MRDSTVYRICPRDAWRAAEARGAFEGAAQDRRDGYIHLSRATQVAGSAARHYGGQAGLVLLTVDARTLGAALRWEPSRGGDLFPHLYGALPVAAVRACRDLPLGADGRHVIPPLDGA
ncbi:MAG: DUF952 domain-containing protein [Kiloniellaceae bacterium]